MRPVVSETAEELYAALGPWSEVATASEVWDLLNYCEAIVGEGRLADIENIIRDSEVGPGWSKVLSAEDAPVAWLPWLAQFVGGRVPDGLDEATQRSLVKDATGFKRGTITALVAAVQAHLTGTKHVLVNERVGGNAWVLGIRTLTAETADTSAVMVAILSQKPAGIIIDYDTMAGHDYGDLAIEYDFYSEVNAAYATYYDLQINDPI